jgi:GTP-binding protein
VELSDCVINYCYSWRGYYVHRYIGYEPFKGAIPGRNNGSFSMEMEKQFFYLSINYKIVVSSSLIPNDEIYEGQVIGETLVAMIWSVNVTKAKTV